MTSPIVRIVRCPACRASCEYSSRNPYRPFCSERCRLHDLGAWARGEHVVATDEPLVPDAPISGESEGGARH